MKSKRIIVIMMALGAVAIGLAFHLHGRAGGKSPADLATYQGLYRGFSPTDGSAVHVGEIQIAVSARAAKVRFATGNGIEELTVSLAGFRRMSDASVEKLLQPGSGQVKNVVGFNDPVREYPMFLFLKDPADGKLGGLVVKWGGDDDLREIAGPTVLYSPSALAKGQYDESVKKAEEIYWPGVIPSLDNGGKSAPRPKSQEPGEEAGTEG